MEYALIDGEKMGRPRKIGLAIDGKELKVTSMVFPERNGVLNILLSINNIPKYVVWDLKKNMEIASYDLK
jgi:hypothetical protein